MGLSSAGCWVKLKAVGQNEEERKSQLFYCSFKKPTLFLEYIQTMLKQQTIEKALQNIQMLSPLIISG